MIHVSLNIGYDTGYQNGVLNKVPFTNRFRTISGFINFTRTSSPYYIEWALKNNVTPSSIVLYFNVVQDIPDEPDSIWENNFTIKCKNIRDYVKIMDLKLPEIESIIRDDVLREILD